MYTLYKHQLDIISDDKKKVGLFLGTGAAKTLTSLCLARGDTLIICPKTQREDQNWEREAKNNNIDINITVISKEEFRKYAHSLKSFKTVIVDEAHTCLGIFPNVCWVKKVARPKTSQLFKELQQYIARTKPERLYLATATIMRSPMTVWGAATILGHGWNFYSFRDTFYIRLPMPGREVWAPKNDTASKIHLAEAVKKIGYVGRLEDYFDVPDQTYRTIYTQNSVQQRARIKEMSLEYPDALVRVGKIHQIENGVLSGDEFSAPELFPNEKINVLLDLSIEFPRMVVFAKFTAQINEIKIAFEKKGKKVLVLNGATKDRGEVIKEANRLTNCIFIAQCQVSAGWELPEYPVMVFASRTYSFVDYDQAIGRIQRANNIKKNLYINLVAKGGTDMAVDRSLSMKQDFNEKLYAKF